VAVTELVIGGSGSGKSAYAEQAVLAAGCGSMYYLATMRVLDAEMEKKVARHKEMRAGRGWHTIEQPVDIGQAADVIAGAYKAPGSAKAPGWTCGGSSAVLLECLSNLVANEMFRDGQIVPENMVVQNIVSGIRRLMACTDCLVIVSNSVFSDGITYDEGTEAYIRALGRINQETAGMADRVTEVVAGIPVRMKY
jgi:adenosylcobinamide kinase/adenosylcobinamide-phosphate guanylyltransferase